MEKDKFKVQLDNFYQNWINKFYLFVMIKIKKNNIILFRLNKLGRVFISRKNFQGNFLLYIFIHQKFFFYKFLNLYILQNIFWSFKIKFRLIK